MQELDPVKYEILYQRLHNYLLEGKEVVRRLACSPIVREAGEVLEAFLLPNGDLALMSTGLLTHVNGMVNGIRYIKENDYERDIGIYDGDQFLNNDSLIGGIHRNDFICIAPVFYEDELVGWVGNLSHVFEIGAIEPGGMCPRAEEAYHEGIVMPCVKIVERGQLKRDILSMMTRTVRDARPIEIDTRAKIAGNELTKERILELIGDFGLDFFTAAARQFIEDSATEAKKIIQSRRPGVYRGRCFSDVLTPYRMGLRMVEARLEFTEEGNLQINAPNVSPQERGFGNCALPGIEGYTLCTLLEHLFYRCRWNGGIMHSTSIDIPHRSMLNVDETGAIGACSILAGQVWQVAVTDALSRAAFAGDKKNDVLASCGLVNCVLMAGVDQFGRTGGNVLGDWACIGGGAKADRDGADSGVVQVNPHNLAPDTESDETMFASVSLSKKHLRDSGGFGKYRGGAAGQGVTVFANTPFFMASHLGYGKYITCGQGLFGGYPPARCRHISLKGSNVLDDVQKGGRYPTTLNEMDNWPGGEVSEEPQWSSMRPIGEKDLLGTSYWGGGGFGDPLERDPELIVQDIRKELATLEVAEKVYAVSINEKTLLVDMEETKKLRAAEKEKRLKNGIPAYEYMKDMVERRERGELSPPVLEFFDRMTAFSSDFVADLEREKEMVRKGALLTEVEGKGSPKDLFELTPYLKVIEDEDGKKLTQCRHCGQIYGLATENFKLGCLIHDRDPKDVQPPDLAPDKEWMVYREFYCPGCGTQVEVEAVPPGMTILHNIEVKL